MFGGKTVAVAATVIVASCGEIQASELSRPRSSETTTIETASGSAVAYTPQVVLAVPESAAYVRPDVVIKLLFSMPMDTVVSTAAFSVVDADGEWVPGSLHWDVTGMVSAFRPDQPLEVGEYRATVDRGACNVEGVELNQPFASPFRVYQPNDSDKPYAG